MQGIAWLNADGTLSSGIAGEGGNILFSGNTLSTPNLTLTSIPAKSSETDILYVGSDGVVACGAASGGGGIAMSGSTVGGVTTYVDANTICAQTGFTQTGTKVCQTHSVDGDVEFRSENKCGDGASARSTVLADMDGGGFLGMYAYGSGHTGSIWGESTSGTSLLWASDTSNRLLIGAHKADSPVQIYHGGAEKMATSSNGVCVCGLLSVTGATSCVTYGDAVITMYRDSANYLRTATAGGTFSIITNGLATATANAMIYAGTDNAILRHGAVTPATKLETISNGICVTGTACVSDCLRVSDGSAPLYSASGAVAVIETHSNCHGMVIYGWTGSSTTNYGLIVSNAGGNVSAGNWGVYSNVYRSEGPVGTGRSHGVRGTAGNQTCCYNYGTIGQLCGTNYGAAIYTGY